MLLEQGKEKNMFLCPSVPVSASVQHAALVLREDWKRAALEGIRSAAQ